MKDLLRSRDRADRIVVGDRAFLRIEGRANTFTASLQEGVTLATGMDGSFLVAWESRRQEDGNFGVYAQRFDPLGKRVGEEIHVNETKPSTQWHPAAAFDLGGRAWIAWESFGQDGDRFGCFLRALEEGCRPAGGEMQVSDRCAGDQEGVVIAALEGGALAAAWIEPGEVPGVRRARARVFTPKGKPLAPSFLLDGRPGRGENLVSLAPLERGGFAAAWASARPDGLPCGILARCFDGRGAPLGPPLAVNEAGDRGSIEPRITARPGAGFAVAWMESTPRGAWRVRFRAFDRTGRPEGPAVLAAEPGEGESLSAVAVAAASDGRLCVAWNRVRPAPERVDVMARFFAPSGPPLAPAFRVNRDEAGSQALRACAGARCLAFGPSGQLLVAWAGEGALGDRTGAHFTLLLPVPSGTAGDLDGNRVVDGRDGALFFDLLAYRDRDPRHYAAADFDHDGTVTLADLEQAPFPGEDPDMAAVIEQGRARFTAFGQALSRARRDLAREAEARARAAAEARARDPALVVRAEAAVPHEPPIHDNALISTEPYGGDRDPFSRGPDFGFVAITQTGWIPPDPHAAVGPDHLVAMTNGAIAFFQKDGTKTFQDKIEGSGGFWGSLGATGFVFDPEAIFDPWSGRFMAMACERTDPGGSGSSYFLLAVSDDADPNGTWYKYRFNVTSLGGGGDIDSPNIAVDQDVVYLTADFFTPGEKYLVYMLEKAPLLAGAPPGITNHLLITGSQSYGIPVMYESGPGMYMIQHFESGAGNTRVKLHAITDPLGTPGHATFNLTVPKYTPPEWPPQQGTSTKIITFDARFWSCVYRNGSLWAAHHQGKNRVLARWYEIAMNGWPASGTPTLVQSGDVDPGGDVRTFFNSVSVDAYGNALTCYARSSPSEYISIGRAFRKAGDPLGAMPNADIVKSSSSPYGYNRWGDYSSVAVDPSDDATFWYHHEYTPNGSWNTWIGSRKVQEFTLTVDVDTLSEATGGTATFTLSNPDHANRQYILLGTLSGTSPGTPLPGGMVVLPLNWDLFTTVIANNLNSPWFGNFLGALDGSGQATAVFYAPALPGLAGYTMDFAYAQDGTVWDFVSNNVSILVVP